MSVTHRFDFTDEARITLDGVRLASGWGVTIVPDGLFSQAMDSVMPQVAIGRPRRLVAWLTRRDVLGHFAPYERLDPSVRIVAEHADWRVEFCDGQVVYTTTVLSEDE